MASKFSQRARKPNYTREETEALLDQLILYGHFLFNKTQLVNNQQKADVWANIAMQVNSVPNSAGRTIDELKHRWQDMAQRARAVIRKNHHEPSHNDSSSGKNPSTRPVPFLNKILQIIGESQRSDPNRRLDDSFLLASLDSTQSSDGSFTTSTTNTGEAKLLGIKEDPDDLNIIVDLSQTNSSNNGASTITKTNSTPTNNNNKRSRAAAQRSSGRSQSETNNCDKRKLEQTTTTTNSASASASVSPSSSSLADQLSSWRYFASTRSQTRNYENNKRRKTVDSSPTITSPGGGGVGEGLLQSGQQDLQNNNNTSTSVSASSLLRNGHQESQGHGQSQGRRRHSQQAESSSSLSLSRSMVLDPESQLVMEVEDFGVGGGGGGGEGERSNTSASMSPRSASVISMCMQEEEEGEGEEEEVDNQYHHNNHHHHHHPLLYNDTDTYSLDDKMGLLPAHQQHLQANSNSSGFLPGLHPFMSSTVGGNNSNLRSILTGQKSMPVVGGGGGVHQPPYGLGSPPFSVPPVTPSAAGCQVAASSDPLFFPYTSSGSGNSHNYPHLDSLAKVELERQCLITQIRMQEQQTRYFLLKERKLRLEIDLLKKNKCSCQQQQRKNTLPLPNDDTNMNSGGEDWSSSPSSTHTKQPLSLAIATSSSPCHLSIAEVTSCQTDDAHFKDTSDVSPRQCKEVDDQSTKDVCHSNKKDSQSKPPVKLNNDNNKKIIETDTQKQLDSKECGDDRKDGNGKVVEKKKEKKEEEKMEEEEIEKEKSEEKRKSSSTVAVDLEKSSTLPSPPSPPVKSKKNGETGKKEKGGVRKENNSEVREENSEVRKGKGRVKEEKKNNKEDEGEEEEEDDDTESMTVCFESTKDIPMVNGGGCSSKSPTTLTSADQQHPSHNDDDHQEAWEKTLRDNINL